MRISNSNTIYEHFTRSTEISGARRKRRARSSAASGGALTAGRAALVTALCTEVGSGKGGTPGSIAGRPCTGIRGGTNDERRVWRRVSEYYALSPGSIDELLSYA
ncbi:hypothetical protein EVAR_49901_1 [Eumeta japonica]|uniref:Uncharacterized protein n=1 Tax=Eumeta variegata TaxID=151549 RepID=A0A4C1Y534_EUMVA|nr:hypothetical protein EVAR_49901_1 [Eumeta japonica]